MAGRAILSAGKYLAKKLTKKTLKKGAKGLVAEEALTKIAGSKAKKKKRGKKK